MKCTGRNCPMQNGTVDPAHCLADECPYVTKPLTNADRIRMMTDEELAAWIENDVAFWGKWCPNDAPVNPETHECMRNGGECTRCILDWLRQEAKE